jgi:hypothetical protein
MIFCAFRRLCISQKSIASERTFATGKGISALHSAGHRSGTATIRSRNLGHPQFRTKTPLENQNRRNPQQVVDLKETTTMGGGDDELAGAKSGFPRLGPSKSE